MASTALNSQTLLLIKSRNRNSWNPSLCTSFVKLPRTSPHKFNPVASSLNTQCLFNNAHHNHDSRNENHSSFDRSVIINQKKFEEIKRKDNSVLLVNLGKIMRATVAFLAGVALLMCRTDLALAASGGRMGGRSFSSPPSSSSSSREYTLRRNDDWSDFSNSAAPYFGPSPYSFSGGSGVAAVCVGPAVSAGSSFSYVMMGFTAFVLVSGFLSRRAEGELITAAEKTSIVKIQVGLLGMARSLQGDLNRIAEVADTSSSVGLHNVLTETILALLRYPSYCISACSSVNVKQSILEGEKQFNQLSIEERGKFDEETLVNVNNQRTQTATAHGPSIFSNEYIVITILVAAGGVYKLPTINSSSDLREALQKLASIPSSRTMAVEVLWTPQNETDTLSERELLQDYPLLQPL